MKRFIFLLTNLLLTTFLSGQQLIANEYPAWGQPVIKRLMAKDPSVTGYGIKDNNRFINIAILDRKSKILYWISCEGNIIEASQLTDIDYGFLISKKVDPFQLYQLLYKKDLQITDNAISKLRFPKNKFYSSADPHYDQYLTQLIKAKRFDTLKTPVQKMAALYKDEQNYLYHLSYAEVGHPLKIKPDSIYGAMLLQAGKGIIKVTQHTDSTGTACFYNKGSLSPVYKAVLDIPSATLYFYQTNQSVFDSIPINRKQILKLIDEGTNVFTLYQNYTLWQLCMLDKSVKQLHDYYTNTKTASKEKKEVQYLLAGFGGDKEALIGKLKQLEGRTLIKLEKLFDVDKNYLDEGLRTSFKYSTVPVRYGEYEEGKGLVIADPVPPYSPPVVSSQTRGNKLYELSDQRGNVMVVVSDKKIQHDDNGDKIVDYNTADVVNATDYSSFGKPLPGRTIEMKDYKYGYNGKENDAETGYQNYGFRMYDPNIARFISVDPLTKAYSALTPYQFAGNTPIQAIDLDGGEEKHYTLTLNKNGTTTLKPTSIKETQEEPMWLRIVTLGLGPKSVKIPERAVVDYQGKNYYIGFHGSYGRGNENGMELFNEFKKNPDATLFPKLFLNENQSYNVEEFSTAVQLQNNAAMYGPLTSNAWYTPNEGLNSSGLEKDASSGLYRGDSRSPEEVFKTGFTAKGTNNNIVDYIEENSSSSYIGTSQSYSEALKKVNTKGYLYVIDNDGSGINVNNYYKAFEGRENPHTSEQEIIFNKEVSTSKIKGAYPVVNGKIDRQGFIKNPSYQSPSNN